jgi:transcriptional regulator with XRE-family HTH domain
MAVDRLTISLRLKAARHLHGRVDDKGKVIPMPVGEVADLPDVRDNGISKNRLEEIEQMKIDARPMELERIALALGMPADWFSSETPVRRSEDALDVLQRALADLGLAPAPSQGASPSGGPGTDRPGEAAGGAGG